VGRLQPPPDPTPARQLRAELASARRAGIPFEEAWHEALRAAPPDWQEAFAATRQAWQRAYERRPATERERALQRLAA
jgi:hypothetical protein